MAHLLEYLTTGVDQILNVWCLIAIFEGTRRIKRDCTPWWKSKLLIVGAIWAVVAGGENLAYLYIVNDTGLLEVSEQRQIGPDWGRSLTAEQRAKDSRALASAAIRSGKGEAKAFDLNGDLVQYCPSAEDIGSYGRDLQVRKSLEQQMDAWRGNAIQWASSIIIAILLALIASHPQYSKGLGFDG